MTPDLATLVYCGYCGRPRTEPPHDACSRRRQYEPPRYCESCGRRMVVQVTPTGWSARCVEHGSIGSMVD